MARFAVGLIILVFQVGCSNGGTDLRPPGVPALWPPGLYELEGSITYIREEGYAGYSRTEPLTIRGELEVSKEGPLGLSGVRICRELSEEEVAEARASGRWSFHCGDRTYRFQLDRGTIVADVTLPVREPFRESTCVRYDASGDCMEQKWRTKYRWTTRRMPLTLTRR